MLSKYLDELFGSQEGFVYCPYKLDGKFTQNWFEWPSHKQSLIEWFSNQSKKADVFVGPALYKTQDISPKSFKGSYTLWCEFDGKTPDDMRGIPTPTIRIQSSDSEHEHWYWRLNTFQQDIKILERLTRTIAYSLEADLSGWDYQQVLRPPTTIHQATGKEVQVLHLNGSNYNINSFNSIEAPPYAPVAESSISGTLPDIGWVVAKYSISQHGYDLLTKEVSIGHRSDALTRLAFELIESGLTNLEILGCLYYADDRYKKFTNREASARKRQLVHIIDYARNSKATKQTAGIDSAAVIYNFDDFMHTEIKHEWIIPGILTVAGAGIMFGTPGIGKTTWVLRMGMCIATGSQSFLNWNIEKQQRVLFLSLEMAHDELKQFFIDMDLTHEETKALNDSFFILPIGHNWPLDVKANQDELLNYIDTHEINMVIIDSLGYAMAGSTSSDDDVKKLNHFLNEDLRKARDVAYWFVHHPRKPGNADVRKAIDSYDMFGSVYISANVQTVINLNSVSGNTSDIKVNIFKARHLPPNQQSFYVKMDSNRSFSIIEERNANRKRSDSSQDNAKPSSVFGPLSVGRGS